MTIYVRQSGSWNAVATPYVRIAGVWTEVTEVHRNIGGTWTKVFPGTALFSSGVTYSTIFNPLAVPSTSTSTISSVVLDSNGNNWTTSNGLIQHRYVGPQPGSPKGSPPTTNETTIRVAANVAETYWSSMRLGSSPTLARSDRTSFTAWNGTYTQWVFAGNTLQIGDGSAVLNILA